MKKNIFFPIILLILMAVDLTVSFGQQPIKTYPRGWPEMIKDAGSKPDTHKINNLLALADTAMSRYFYGRGKMNFDITTELLNTISILSKQLNDNSLYNKGLLLQIRLLEIQKSYRASDSLTRQVMAFYRQAPVSERAAAFYFLSGSWKYRLHGREVRQEDSSGFQQAINYYRSIGDKYREASLQRVIGLIYLTIGDRQKAIGIFSELYAFQTKINDNTRQKTSDLLSHCLAVTGRLPEALNYALQSLNTALEVKDSVEIYHYYYRLGRISYNLGEWDKGTAYLQKALYHAELQADTTEIIHVTSIMCQEGLMKTGKYREAFKTIQRVQEKYPITYKEDYQLTYDLVQCLAACAMQAGQYQVAEKYYLRQLNAIEKEDSLEKSTTPADRIGIYSDLGALYQAEKKLSNAAYYYNKVLKIGEQTNSLPTIRDIQLQLFRVDSLNGNYISAMAHYQVYKAVTDSLFNESKSQQIAELEVRYDTKEREKALQLLTTQSQLQQTAIRQGKMVRNSVIAAAVLLVILLLLLLSRYRIRQLANKALQEKQEEINKQNLSLEKLVLTEKKLVQDKDKLLEDKEWLIKEIHHRVKNNLQIVMSLLNSQSAYLRDESALEAIREIQQRVRVISLIHQKLYQSDNLKVIDLPSYIKEVTEYLAGSTDTGSRIDFQVDVQPIQLDVSQTVPLGLIINEAITNSIKYAFPCGRSGLVMIELHNDGKGAVELTIADNGIGLPEEFDRNRSSTLGMALMKGLSKQLDAEFNLINHEGLTVQLKFKLVKTA